MAKFRPGRSMAAARDGGACQPHSSGSCTEVGAARLRKGLTRALRACSSRRCWGSDLLRRIARHQLLALAGQMQHQASLSLGVPIGRLILKRVVSERAKQLPASALFTLHLRWGDAAATA